MEKEPQPDSLATVTIKPEYPPSEVYSSEPPPAYHKHKSSAVQVARIIAFTIVTVSVILGGFMLASAYITANGCRQHELELQLLSESADRLQPEALIQADAQQQQTQAEPLISDESKNVNDVQDNAVHQDQTENVENNNNSESNSNESSESEENYNNVNNLGVKVPLQIDFDDLMSTLMERNQKSKLNCIVEKKRADEIIDHQAKMAQLPFGINLRTDPRYEHISGERIAIVCESGNVQKVAPPEEQEETIMIQPVMIPIPPQHFQTHMAQMMPPQVQAQQAQQTQNVAQIPLALQQAIRAGMMIPRPQQVEHRPPYFNPQLREQFSRPQPIPSIEQRPGFMQQHEVREIPRFPPMTNVEHRSIVFQPGFENRRPQPMPDNMLEQRPQPQPQIQPNPLIHHIIQQIINERIQAEKQNEENDVRSTPSQYEVPPAIEKFPIPDEILTQINRLPSNRGVIVAVSESEPDDSSEEMHVIQQQQQQPRQNAQEMNGKQVPVISMIQEQPQPEASNEETRPHFVHPRSIQ